MFSWEFAEQSIINGSSSLEYHSKGPHIHTHTQGYNINTLYIQALYGGREVDNNMYYFIPGYPFCILYLHLVTEGHTILHLIHVNEKCILFFHYYAFLC